MQMKRFIFAARCVERETPEFSDGSRRLNAKSGREPVEPLLSSPSKHPLSEAANSSRGNLGEGEREVAWERAAVSQHENMKGAERWNLQGRRQRLRLNRRWNM